MNTSVDYISPNILRDDKPVNSIYADPKIVELSNSNISQVYSILSYKNLPENWDSYGAKRPNTAAIVKAVNFIISQLDSRGYTVFFTAPTSDGDIVVELKHAGANLEFIFSSEVGDKIVASCNGDFHAEEILNETTLHAYLKWLHQ